MDNIDSDADRSRTLPAKSGNTNVSKTIELILTRIPEIDRESLNRVVGMKLQGLSLPFIARYRQKEVRGITESQLREMDMQYESAMELEQKKEKVLAGLVESLDTDMVELAHAELDHCLTVEDVEMVVSKYTSTEEAVETRMVRSAFENLDAVSLAQHVKACCRGDCFASSNVASDIPDSLWIVGSWIFEDPHSLPIARAVIRRTCRDIQDFKPHQWLALRREKGSIEPSYFQIESSSVSEMLLCLFEALVSPTAPLRKLSLSFQIPKNSCLDLFVRSLSSAIVNFIIPCMRREMLEYCDSRANQTALENFAINIRHKLLQPGLQLPSGSVVFGIDPGITSGSKCVVYNISVNSVIDKFLFYSPKDISPFLKKFEPVVIVLGDGTGSVQVRQMLSSVSPDTLVCVVSESGASRYSISELGVNEFPSLPVEFRGCVSLVRRALDPLSELTKIEPQHLSVGIYQHDMSKQLLGRYLEEVVRECVAVVGVELNTATVAILSLIPGLDTQKANAIVRYRNSCPGGRIQNRFELRNVEGIDERAWINSAGFVRVADSNLSPLDNTAIHPEQYGVANTVVAAHEEFRHLYSSLIPNLGVSPENESEILRLLRLSDPRELEPPLTVKPAKDWVVEKPESVVGKRFHGIVKTVTPFGAFISLDSIGITGKDGLLHVSEYPLGIEDPQYFAANQEVYVEVESVSARISLTARI